MRVNPVFCVRMPVMVCMTIMVIVIIMPIMIIMVIVVFMVIMAFMIMVIIMVFMLIVTFMRFTGVGMTMNFKSAALAKPQCFDARRGQKLYLAGRGADSLHRFFKEAFQTFADPKHNIRVLNIAGLIGSQRVGMRRGRPINQKADRALVPHHQRHK